MTAGACEGVCANCSKPLRAGHVVFAYSEIELHADCQNPRSLNVARQEGDPNPMVLRGKPLTLHPIPGGAA